MDTSLREWMVTHTVDDKMFWKSASGEQISFIYNKLGPYVCKENYQDADEFIRVISDHRSKSIVLPVYKIISAGRDITFILRDNFYNWKMSVISEKPIKANFDGLFYTSPPVEPDYTGDHLDPVYFEGFDRKWVFGYYDTSNGKKWSAELYSVYDLWTAVHLCLLSVGAIQPLKYHTRESHKKALAEEHRQWEERKAKRGENR